MRQIYAWRKNVRGSIVEIEKIARMANFAFQTT
jgi:hypothetical protein